MTVTELESKLEDELEMGVAEELDELDLIDGIDVTEEVEFSDSEIL